MAFLFSVKRESLSRSTATFLVLLATCDAGAFYAQLLPSLLFFSSECPLVPVSISAILHGMVCFASYYGPTLSVSSLTASLAVSGPGSFFVFLRAAWCDETILSFFDISSLLLYHICADLFIALLEMFSSY